MLTIKYQNSKKEGLLPIQSLDYSFVIFLIALVDIRPLSCECGINGLLRAILNAGFQRS